MSSVHVGSSEQLNVYLQPAQGEFGPRHPDEGSTIGGEKARLLGRLWLRATAVAMVVLIVSGLATVLAVSLVPVSVGTAVAVTAFCATFLLSNVIEPFGEWRSLVQDRASGAAHVYSAIFGDLRRAQVPARVAAFRVAMGDTPSTAANRLEITDGAFTVSASVFPYGTSLYMGWTMFRRRSGAAVLLASLTEFVRSLRRRPDTVQIAIEAERPLALREAVHASCLVGLKVAVENIEVPIDFGFPEGLPPVGEFPGLTRARPASTPLPGTLPPPATEAAGSVESPTVAVSIYLADARGAEQLEAAVEGFLAERGFEVASKAEPVISG